VTLDSMDTIAEALEKASKAATAAGRPAIKDTDKLRVIVDVAAPAAPAAAEDGACGRPTQCDGYATALSVRAALKSMKQRYKLHVCFSAGNMVRVAAGLECGIVIADHDQSGTGQQAAKEIGWPSWLSDVAGEDANDYHQRAGLFALSQGLTHLMFNVSASG
jgi:phage/plasmid primase-like uncharacterized protein